MKKENKQEEDKIDPVQDFNENCKKHVNANEKNIWLCYDCHKFTCTKCYAREHKQCWADLIENMYDEMKKTNESNLEAIKGMRSEFADEVKFMEEKYDYFLKNNPFDMNIKLVNKIYDDIVELVNKKREDTLHRMNLLKENYEKNITQNIEKIKEMIKKSDDIERRINKE